MKMESVENSAVLEDAAHTHGLGDADQFQKDLEANLASANEQEIASYIARLEKYSQANDRTIEVYTDLDLQTFCCGQVPSKIVTSKGEIVEDLQKKTYLIGVPFKYIAGKAPEAFNQGEIEHEKGHAFWTDFGRMKRFETLSRQEGYDPEELRSLDNCIEDPRMERLVGGPRHEGERKLLWEKNRLHIIPNIAQGIRGSEDKPQMSPTDQFKFIIKLERLWAIHERDRAGIEKPWSLDDLHPRVREEFEEISPYLEKITGDAVRPSMKVNAEVEKLIVDHIWPAHKRLIEEFPDDGKGEGDGKPGDGNSGSQQKGKGKGKRGAPSEGGIPEGEPSPLDPNDPSSWPDDLQKIFQKMKEKHENRLKENAEKQKESTEKQASAKEKKEKEIHELLKQRDGFEDPKLRIKYNEVKEEVAPITGVLKRVFQQFLPKVDEPQYDWGRSGIRFSIKRYVQRLGSGQEKPLGRRKTPEKNALILQLLVDVSGSMYQDKQRIENSVKAVIATCEAAKDHNIFIEILANDQGDACVDGKYIIKSFQDPYDGPTKSRIVEMMVDGQDGKERKFGGSNQDGAAIRVATSRLQRQHQRVRAQADRVGTLAVYMSDSTTQSEDTKKAVEEAREVTPFEGTAITPEGDIPEYVKYHFGKDSLIPKSIEEFPDTIREILERHIKNLKPLE